MKRKWQIILSVLVVCIIAVVISSNQNKELEARLLEVQPTSIEKTFKEDGNIVLNEEHYIYANSEGEITDLPVEEGEYVKQGDILLQLNTTELQFQLQQLKGELKSIQAQESLEHSKLDTDKLKQLYEIGAISKKEYEDALNTLNSDIYSGQIQALKAQIDLVQYKINKSTVYAPNDGIVSKLDIKEGMVIASGLPLMTIYKEDDYLVEVYVLTENATKISPSMEVTLIQDNKDEDMIFKGTVEKLASRAEEKTSALGLLEQRIKVTIKPDIPKNLNLRPGYALDAEFTTSKQSNKLIVPKTALFPYQDGDAVWVIKNGKAEIQPVKKGFENDKDVVIETGLKSGDLVLLDPQLEGIKEGKQVKQL